MTREPSTSNPLAGVTPEAWAALIEQANPAMLLVVIERRMGAVLRSRMTPEDVFQEALLQAWRDRARVEWRGLRAWRSWLLTIIDHRLRDLADRDGAQKRGGNAAPIPGAFAVDGDAASALAGSTTPSRVAMRAERAAAMSQALAALPEDVREVVRLRLFEQASMPEIAAQLGIGVSAARHRFRKGAEEYRARLLALLGPTGLSSGA